MRTLLELQGELRVMRRELAQAHSDLSKRLAALTNSVDGNAAVLDAITGLVRKRRARITATDNL